jgi:arylsulfatase
MMDGKWMRQGDLKAVLIPVPDGPGEWRLFNVAEDPGEANDLSAEMPEKLEELKAAWDRYADEVGVVPS